MDLVSLTDEEIKSIHTIERKIFKRLVSNLGRDIGVSMQIIALWLWLEQMGFPSVIHQVSGLPDIVLNSLAEEAVTCLRSLENRSSFQGRDILFTLNLMERYGISLQFIHENQICALKEVTSILVERCMRAFSDISIVPQAIKSQGGVQEGQMIPTMASNIPSFLLTSPTQPSQVYSPIPSPAWILPDNHFSKIQIVNNNLEMGEPSISHPNMDLMLISSNLKEEAREDNRIMFVTFSRGYPVTKVELHEFLTRRYGDCIEAIYMQDGTPDAQPLFARVVFYSSSFIDTILGGNEKESFVINGKHVRMRRYMSNRGSK
ncbi:hypothetical protein GIB67_009033 [Kingdonia uniflora]|uniref:RRM domain-containing protein n=1 Tax=Kingdonia uniflora TaxID=39325 RepID=A0A7J7LVX8_9MAGN|nr:hypothetical protein GIB67_009033 [Kingdonia uniflora]